MCENFLYFGDNLDILRDHIKDETIDLIYLDPPFKSNRNYNILFQERNGSESKAQIKAFEDTWKWNDQAEMAYQDVVESGPERLSKVMQAFRTFLGNNDMMAYLAMMAPRLVELHRVLKPTGSIYLHCDPTTSHYLKILMDAIFGPGNMQNEIIWGYRTGGVSKKHFARKHDTLLFYGKTEEPKFFPMQERIYYEKPFFTTKQDENGRYFADVYIRDVWDDIKPVINVSSERLGYPTQKPISLLERIIRASSEEGDIVLDPFCGCGTAVTAAQALNRRWIGIDITYLAIALIKSRLRENFGDKIKYKVIGEPVTLPDARALAREDPYQFQWWAISKVIAQPVEKKKGADKGIDGRLYFHDEVSGAKVKTKQIILQVKSGYVSTAHIRDLRGVIERENAEIGVLITLKEPSKAMKKEAISAGFYYSPGWQKRYPRIQILTVKDLLAGKRINYPGSKEANVIYKKPPSLFKISKQENGKLPYPQ